MSLIFTNPTLATKPMSSRKNLVDRYRGPAKWLLWLLYKAKQTAHSASAVLLDTLLDLGPLLMGPGPSVTLDEGDELQWSRYLGVGPDMASVTGEWLERQGTAVETIAGTVKADDQVVPGARVHVQDESGQVITYGGCG